ncbi:MAG: hypothetical protein ACYCTE_06755, partial [Acidimicrobiales bacterium]
MEDEMDDEVTEFTDLDPEEIHLVLRGANLYPALLAKSAATNPKKEGKNMSKHQTTSVAKAQAVTAAALAPLEKALKEAKKSGKPWAVETAALRLAKARMIIAENARQGQPSKFG